MRYGREGRGIIFHRSTGINLPGYITRKTIISGKIPPHSECRSQDRGIMLLWNLTQKEKLLRTYFLPFRIILMTIWKICFSETFVSTYEATLATRPLSGAHTASIFWAQKRRQKLHLLPKRRYPVSKLHNLEYHSTGNITVNFAGTEVKIHFFKTLASTHWAHNPGDHNIWNIPSPASDFLKTSVSAVQPTRQYVVACEALSRQAL
jgi:hypothetical protein